MTNDEIVEAAVREEAKRRHAIDADLIVVALDGAEIRVIQGEAVASDVRDRVAEISKKKPHLFRVPDAAKMTDAQFAELEAKLREPKLRAPETVPSYVREIAVNELSDEEHEALGRVLVGSRDWHALDLVEKVAQRQGIDTAPAAA